MQHLILRSLILSSLALAACADSDGGPADGPGHTCGDGGSGDSDAPGPIGTFQLTKTCAIAGELPVVGIDSDRAGGLWIAYRVELGDFYTPADVRVVHLDADGRKQSEWRYDDEFTMVRGIAFSGDAVWLNYNGGSGVGNNHIRKLDPVTGDTLGSFATEAGIVDLDAHDGELRLSSSGYEVIALDVATGSEHWRVPLAAEGYYRSQRGIATTADGRSWIASVGTNQITLLDPQHGVIGAGVTDELANEWYGEDLHLAWDGDELVLTTRNQIIWLAPPSPAPGTPAQPAM